MVKIAGDAGCEVEFSPEGYSRMRKNFDFTTELFRAAIQAGATIINCPDTIGGACLIQGKDYFVENMKKHAQLMKHEFPNIQIMWSAHCHNDFGLAVQNTINAVFKGPARQIEGCINGIGERAGNAALRTVHYANQVLRCSGRPRKSLLYIDSNRKTSDHFRFCEQKYVAPTATRTSNR